MGRNQIWRLLTFAHNSFICMKSLVVVPHRVAVFSTRTTLPLNSSMETILPSSSLAASNWWKPAISTLDTGLQSLSLQEQWEAFQIRVYDRSEGALGAIKSLIGGATMGRLRRRRKSKVSPAPLILSASPATPLPSHPFSSTPNAHVLQPSGILWFLSTTIAHPRPLHLPLSSFVDRPLHG